MVEGLKYARAAARLVLPASARRYLLHLHREYVFRRALSRFRRLPDFDHPSRDIISSLVYGWDNESWSAQHEFLAAVLRHCDSADGPILECGSGLSTVLLGLVAQRRGNTVWSLEHEPFWAERVAAALDRHGVTSVRLCRCDLRSYGAYTWYAPPLERMPSGFGLVVCDGPPGDTPGGRYGMLPIMKTRLARRCVILLDDVQRPAEREVAERWAQELQAPYRVVGREKPFAVIEVN